MTGELFEGDALAHALAAHDAKAREEFPTPRSLVRAALRRPMAVADASGALRGRPVRVLDVCAGWGVWASEMRRLAGLQGWQVHITGVEIDESKFEHLAKWCDEVACSADWSVFLGDQEHWGCRESGYDIAMGNPHFTALATDDPAESMPAVLLRHAPAVLLLHTQQAFIRGKAGRRVLRAYPRAHVWDVPGSVSFTPDGKADARCYQVSLWLRDYSGETCQSLLPEPPNGAGAWRYSVTPGSEEPSEDLPAAPGWSP